MIEDATPMLGMKKIGKMVRHAGDADAEVSYIEKES